MPGPETGARMIVVATQGRGDRKALYAALSSEVEHIAFVGSRKKAAVLRAELAADGIAPERAECFRAPAGADIGAITPDEIAVSILAELIAVRRRGQRATR